jgi:phosphoenolpyruvate carboxykinase (GTP)
MSPTITKITGRKVMHSAMIIRIDDKVLDAENLKKITDIKNDFALKIVQRYIELCKPSKVRVLTGTKGDIEYIRKLALRNGEEKELKMDGHTIHFDGYSDQGRDKKNTCVLLPKGKKLSPSIVTRDRDEGLTEVLGLMDGIMEGKEMLVCFFCLGPNNSKFSIPALQITDSAYVIHSESILYRQGYQEFMRLNGSDKFFHFVHSAGELDENMNCKNTDKRRIFMDLEENRVFTINNQYAGNSVGLKKLALRLAINKANYEDWLCEHMFIMGVHPEGKKRVTFFTGAYPSACGKTSTAMIPGQSIIGDDIAYIKLGDNGVPYAVNVEQGIFGIISDVNPVDDPVIYHTLTTPRELIFSNVLEKNGAPYWLNMGKELPETGTNFSGKWHNGKIGPDSKEILPAHKNARYTIRINELSNADPQADDPNGVPVSGFIYGGRDSDTHPPITESLSWSHGVFIGAALESETTAATIGKEGERKHNPMANMDFLVIPLGLYIKNHLKFGEDADKLPLIFSTNYFLKDENGKYLNDKTDKKIWMLWAEGRVHHEYEVIETPIGFIPKYEDIKVLFKNVFDKNYTKEQYEKQFSIRTDKLLSKLDRIEAIYKQEEVPEEFSRHISQQRGRLMAAKTKFKKDVISPFDFE